MPNVSGIKTAADGVLNIELLDGCVQPESDPSLIPLVQYYKHFDLTDEQLGWTVWPPPAPAPCPAGSVSGRRYNCWGFTFLPRRYWIANASDVDQILSDNCLPVAPGSLRPGDVIRYRDNNGITTHTGRVWQVDAAGNCVKVRSKWGSMSEYVHPPDHPYIYQDDVYGKNLAYFRQVAPLKGIGDLWIGDAANDNGEQFSFSQWVSPDILVDAPPYGSVDVNPVFGAVNRVWVTVRNRGDIDINNARVRYYWANPFAGFAPSNWQLIPPAAGHPNPTNAFTVPANSSVQAPYVEWVPIPAPGVSDPAHQCLLAIAYINDDPKDSTNPDPLVYPFEIAWDNNVAARNVHVVGINKAGKAKLQLGVAMPFDGVEKLYVDLRMRLAFVPRMPVFGFPPKVIPPRIDVTLGDRRPFRLTEAKELAPSDTAYVPHMGPAGCRGHAWLAGRTIAIKQIRRLPLTAKRPLPLRIEMAVPRAVKSGANFLLWIEQEVQNQITGCYVVALDVNP